MTATKPGSAYQWYVVALLMMVFAVNFLDRQVINILAESIKRDLHISDTQLGLLTGTAFGVFYSLLGLPIARLADKHHRVGIITLALLLWSSLTGACSLASNFVQLFLCRLGVGVGEAGGTPPSQSLISDYVPQGRRSLAMSVFNAGLPLGSFLGFMLGGMVSQRWGWRAAFVCAGLPGVLVAGLVWFTLREPVRGRIDGVSATSVSPLSVTLKELLAQRSFIWLVVGSTFSIFIIYVTNAWLPSLFFRVHGLTAGQFGRWIALSTGLGGAIGVFGGGLLVDRLKPRFPKAEIVVPIVSSALGCPILVFTALSSGTTTALAGMFMLYTLAYVWLGPSSAMIQRAAPVRGRALANGIQLAVANVFALSLGPPLVGFMSDRLQPVKGVNSIRYALAYVSVGALLASAAYAMASIHIAKNSADEARLS